MTFSYHALSSRFSVAVASRPKATALASACANLYSRGQAAMGRELELRTRALDIVSEFIGDVEWQAKVPIQKGGPPSFGFLFESAADSEGDVVDGASGADLSDGEGDGDD